MCRPILRPTTKPSTFSVVPQPLLDASPLNDSKTGAWLVLDLSNDGTFALPSPLQAGLYSDLNPRDRWVRQWIDRVAWFFTKRFTLRCSIGAHLALDVEMQLLAPEEVLSRGGVEWKAELVDKEKVVQGGGKGETMTLPNHAVVQSVVPRQTAEIKPKRRDTVVFRHESQQEPAEILASDTINLERDAESAPRFPCPKIYLHLVVREAGVPIPPASELATMHSVSGALFRMAEWVFGSLTSTSAREEARKTAPIHITLERLYIGAVPATALTMTLPMALMLLLGWLGIKPVLNSLLPKVQKAGKDE